MGSSPGYSEDIIIVDLFYTRAEEIEFALFPGNHITLPEGVKAVITVIHRVRSSNTGEQAWSEAIFYKVMSTDPNAYVDCDADVLNMIYGGEMHAVQGGLEQVFDASQGDTSYS